MFQPVTESWKQKFGTSAKNIFKKAEKEDVSHVTSWAVNFDRLLRDKAGVLLFEVFLKLEFSEENIEFWKDCEEYKNINDSGTRLQKARALYDTYLTPESPKTVNVDDDVRIRVSYYLDNPSTEVFAEAQKQTVTLFASTHCLSMIQSLTLLKKAASQYAIIAANNEIYNLMKQDSYPRFLKSDIFKNSLVQRMEKNQSNHNIFMDTNNGERVGAIKGGSLQRHFGHYIKIETVGQGMTKRNGENNENSWIRKRLDSINSILRRRNRNKH